jgi:hypothetical protein
LASDPSLFEDKQLFVGSAEHDPARETIAAQVSAEGGEGHIDFVIAWNNAHVLFGANAQ